MEIIIKPKNRWSLFDWRELWQYKELLYFFAWRDLKVRYKQTIVGIAWVVFQPLFTMIIFTVFFNKLAGIQADNAPYPLFVLIGLLIWQFFLSSLTEITNCLISNKHIITKVYFPRLLLPTSIILTRLIDFTISTGLLVILMFYYNFYQHLTGLLIIPLLCLITGILSLGLGLFLSALNAKYRDIAFVLPFFTQMLLFVTPVIYSASLTGNYSRILALNPLTGIIKAARAALLGDFPLNWLQLGLSALASIIILIIGLVYFRKVEKSLADLI